MSEFRVDTINNSAGTGAPNFPNGLTVATGTVTTPAIAFSGDTNTGIYNISADTIGFSAGGAERARIDSNGIELIDGTAASPSISFSSDNNTGIYRSNPDQISFSAGGSEVGRVTSTYGGFKGNVIQVVSATKTDTATFSSSTFGDITGLSVNITPRYSNSKMLIMAMICYGSDSNTAIRGFFRFMRDSTPIGIGDTASNRVRASFVIEPFWSTYSITMGGMNFLDTVSSTTQITYKIQAAVSNNGTTAYINRDYTYGDTAGYATGTSSITVMEIQQ